MVCGLWLGFCFWGGGDTPGAWLWVGVFGVVFVLVGVGLGVCGGGHGGVCLTGCGVVGRVLIRCSGDDLKRNSAGLL